MHPSCIDTAFGSPYGASCLPLLRLGNDQRARWKQNKSCQTKCTVLTLFGRFLPVDSSTNSCFQQLLGVDVISILVSLGVFLKQKNLSVNNELYSARTLYGIDSQVTLGAVVKGRSASASLNRELRRFLPSLLFHDSYSEFMYYRSKDNPADDPTRGEILRKPCVELPSWWKKLMKSLKIGSSIIALNSSYDLTGLPPTKELMRGNSEVPECGTSSSSASLPQAERESTGFEHLEAEGNSVKVESLNEARVSESAETIGGSEISQPVKHPPNCVALFSSWFGTLSESESAEVASILGSFDSSQVYFSSSSSDWPPNRCGFLDLFSGEKGVAKKLQQYSNTWTLTFDIEHSPKGDLNSKVLQDKLERLLRLGVFCGWAAPVCSSFSTAITPPVRTLLEPWGVSTASAGMKEKLRTGNRSAMWLLSLMQISLQLGVHFWLENPDLSWIFRLPPWKKFTDGRHKNLGFWRLDYCRYGTPWRKRTRILTTSCLKGFRTLCLGCKAHLKLRGRSPLHRNELDKGCTAIREARQLSLGQLCS